jgi:hypothetical protein
MAGRKTPAKPSIITGPHPSGGWQSRVAESSRTAHIHVSKSAAEAQGKQMAKARRTEHIVQDKSGQIQRKDSYGNDPCGRRRAGIFAGHRPTQHHAPKRLERLVIDSREAAPRLPTIWVAPLGTDRLLGRRSVELGCPGRV